MTTTNTWSYRNDLSHDVTADVVGYDVSASDGDIGKIDEASTDAGRNYVVVDTGFWIFGKKRLIPAGVITRIDHDDRKVHVAMTKDEIKSAPDYDADVAGQRNDDYYESFGTYYRDYGW
jgi:hypothetical protein